MELQQGALLQGGKYKIEKSLGQGGFGITYLAEQTNLGRKVCIKEFFMKEYGERTESSEAASDATVLTDVSAVTSAAAEIMGRYQEKFVKEARTIAKLNHPGIVRIHDVFEENGTAYYVMDFIEGENFNDLVKREGALPEERALGYIRQVAEALSYVHDHKIMHLDVKPANIIVRKSDDKAILIDFGTAKQYDSEGTQTSTTPVGLSAGYAPIEMTKPGGVQTFSPETDVYSLGATLYYLVTGQNPPDASERIEMIMEGETLHYPGNISQTVITVIEQALQSRKKRPQTVAAFLESLPAIKPENSEKKRLEFCPNCGEKLSPNAKFCPNCGVSILGVDSPLHINEAKEPTNRINDYHIFLDATGDIKNGVVKEDIDSDLDSIKTGAENGDSAAQLLLGVYYMWTGNTEEQASWLKRAADNNNIHALARLGYKYMDDAVNQDLGMDSPIFQKGLNMLSKAASMGETLALLRLGECYQCGWGVAGNIFMSYQLWKQGAEGGDATCQFALGNLLRKNDARLQDYNAAFKWLKLAVDNGCQDALNSLGECYLYGHGTETNYEKAFNSFISSKESGESQHNLGKCYLNGWGTEMDHKEAERWFNKALNNVLTDHEKTEILLSLIGIESEDRNGFSYVDLGLPSGTKWAVCNIGAKSPTDRGDLFAWGETTHKNVFTFDNYIFYKKKLMGGYKMTEYAEDGVTLAKKDDAANVNWGGGWRMPSLQEFHELCDNTTIKQLINFERGLCYYYSLTSKINGKHLIIPATGFKNGKSREEEDNGFYWCSDGKFYEFEEEDWDINLAFGLSIRPVL